MQLDGGRIFCDTLLVFGCPIKTTAYATITVATIISLALVAYGFMQTSLVFVLVAVYMLQSTYELFKHVQSGLIAEHPLFKFTAEANANATYGTNQQPTQRPIV